MNISRKITSLVLTISFILTSPSTRCFAVKEVLEAQGWFNENYNASPGCKCVEETGTPGSLVSEALISAMQIELNIIPATGSFGPITQKACDDNVLNLGDKGVRVKILKYGLYCKGYTAGKIDDTFDEDLEKAVVKIQKDAGLLANEITTSINGVVAKAILDVDEYVKVSRGDSKIRSAQQELNREYRDYAGLSPCDGIYSRRSNEAMIYALQKEEHLPKDVANGYFGPTTKKCCPDIPYASSQKDYYEKVYDANSIERFVKLLKYQLYFMGYNPGDFNGEFNDAVMNAISIFRKDCALGGENKITIDDWMSLFVSTGNPDREAKAVDCSERLNYESAKQLKSMGYEVVGRYLTGDMVSSTSNRVYKNLLKGEMKNIFDAGLNIFLIYQDPRDYFNPKGKNKKSPNDLYDYFNESRGKEDAAKAFAVAKGLGVPQEEIIYFTVDYDFMEHEVKSKIIDYFKGIKQYKENTKESFRIGIYGSRNTCTLVSKAGLSQSSFVSDLSTGYSGNMGYPLPKDWAFDQIKETRVFFKNKASQDIFLAEIDRIVKSGRYGGFSSFVDSEVLGNGGFYTLVRKNHEIKEDCEYPGPKVFWDKKLLYFMHDCILLKSVFSMFDLGGGVSKVCFTSAKGFTFNVGFVETNSLRNGSQSLLYEDIRKGSDCGDFPYKDNDWEEFRLDKNLKLYSQAGGFLRILEENSHVKILGHAGKMFPNYILCTEYMTPKDSRWVYADTNGKHGFLDLDLSSNSVKFPCIVRCASNYARIPGFHPGNEE